MGDPSLERPRSQSQFSKVVIVQHERPESLFAWNNLHRSLWWQFFIFH